MISKAKPREIFSSHSPPQLVTLIQAASENRSHRQIIMFIERPATQLIHRTFFGASGAMPVDTSLKVGDSVTLMQTDAIVKAKVTAELAAGGYRGVVEEVTAINPETFPVSVSLAGVEQKVGENIEFTERQVHRCTHQSI